MFEGPASTCVAGALAGPALWAARPTAKQAAAAAISAPIRYLDLCGENITLLVIMGVIKGSLPILTVIDRCR
jgi:hypothetical protein